jgi:uncharacterized protein (DUF952 family)
MRACYGAIIPHIRSNINRLIMMRLVWSAICNRRNHRDFEYNPYRPYRYLLRFIVATESRLVEQSLRQIRALERQIAVLHRTIERSIEKAEDRDRLAYDSHFAQETIYHLTPAAYFNAFSPDQEYVPEPFAKEGFIHCTRGADLLAYVANNFYRKEPGEFVMLVIEVDALRSPLKYEALGTPAPFPHIYGPLNRDAIVEIVKMPRAADGTFLVPPYDDVS